MDANDFREFAKECEHWARQTSNPSHRQIMLDMARTWRNIAKAVEHRTDLTDDEVERRPRPQDLLRRLMD